MYVKNSFPFIQCNLIYNIQTRKGTGFGDQKLYDAISHDGLTDAFNKIAMGNCA